LRVSTGSTGSRLRGGIPGTVPGCGSAPPWGTPRLATYPFACTGGGCHPASGWRSIGQNPCRRANPLRRNNLAFPLCLRRCRRMRKSLQNARVRPPADPLRRRIWRRDTITRRGRRATERPLTPGPIRPLLGTAALAALALGCGGSLRHTTSEGSAGSRRERTCRWRTHVNAMCTQPPGPIDTTRNPVGPMPRS
jgi:hypothetical protein